MFPLPEGFKVSQTCRVASVVRHRAGQFSGISVRGRKKLLSGDRERPSGGKVKSKRQKGEASDQPARILVAALPSAFLLFTFYFLLPYPVLWRRAILRFCSTQCTSRRTSPRRSQGISP